MEDEEDNLCRYGTALPPFEEDAVPSKRPITIEDQIVLDSNGKRRFHGAFTGGFSAGYWNTVGSEEGWKPREFKSSRSEKSAGHTQNPIDFMDEEDLGEFGFAPQRVQTKDDFVHRSSTGVASERTNKRRLDMSFSKGPIPGQPVLRSLLEPAKEKTAVRMLKKMGWREGQGIGERQSRNEKKRTKERNRKEQYIMKTYGCEMPGHSKQIDSENHGDSSSESSDSDDSVTFAPDDFDPLVAAFKDNTFGLGYSGLDRGTTKRFNLFDTFEVIDKNNKKLSIRGQAFGIGALEDDDDLDVYARDDMSRYDFSLQDGKPSSKSVPAITSGQQGSALEGFCAASSSQKSAKKVFHSQMPDNFRPRNWLERRSRFDPLNVERSRKINEANDHKIKGLGRHDLNPSERGSLLGEKKEFANPLLEMINNRSSNFVSKEVICNDVVVEVKETVEGEPKQNCLPVAAPLVPSGALNQPQALPQQQHYLGSTKEGFKPFIAIPDKQDRYERFLAFQPTERYITREQFLESLQPLSLSAWERERELKEFMQAERMYRPLDGLMSDRFVTASALIADKTISVPGDPEAAKVSMKRTRTMWKPHKDLCKRFNVPEPFGGMMCDEENSAEKRSKERGKFSVFDYLETPMTNRRDFVTPSILPRVSQTAEQKPREVSNVTSHRITSKDIFETDSSILTPKEDTSADVETAATAKVVAQSPAKTSTVKTEKKRSELEMRVLEATNKKPEEKRDLFQSIFCSSEDEDDVQSETAESKSAGKASMTHEEKMQMLDSIVAIKPAQQVNILRNNSPPRGIFKSLFEFKKSQPNEAEAEEGAERNATKATAATDKGSPSSSESDSESGNESVPRSESYYGPKLPSAESGAGLISSDGQQEVRLDDRLRHLLGETQDGNRAEVWVEKPSERHSSGRNKKKKKHKEQHKSKSKSKHKKDKKKSSHKHKHKK